MIRFVQNPPKLESFALPPELDALQVELTYWKSVTADKTLGADGYQAYLDKYPEGQFAALAKIKLIVPNRAAERTLDGHRVIKTVSEMSRTPINWLVSERRARHIAYPRMVAMSLMRDLTALSLPQIGKMLGGRDHTTVMHAVQTLVKIKAGLIRNADTDKALALWEQARAALTQSATPENPDSTSAASPS